jgi:hypothetical protein
VADDDADGVDEVYVDFGAVGLWRFDQVGGSWIQMSSLDAASGLRMDTINPGFEEACAAFPAQGIWRMTFPGAPVYYLLTGTSTSEDDHASAKFTGGAAEDLVVDFGTLGLWLLKENDYIWHNIDPNSVDRVREVYFVGDTGAELLIRYNASPAGLWLWDYAGFPGAVTQLHAWTPDPAGFVEPFDVNGDTETNGDQEVAVDFGSNGLWKYDSTDLSWIQLSGLDPEFMVAGDYGDVGYKGTLIVDFGPAYGLWQYTASTGAWLQISGLSPDSVL